MPPIGTGATEQEGSLYDLMQSIPYLATGNRLPPIEVLNSIFEKGFVDAGMSGGISWNPFTIDTQDFEELSTQCIEPEIDIAECPSWVANYSDFLVWIYEVDRGVPAAPHKKLADEADQASRVLKNAIESGASETEILELHLKSIESGQKLVEFLEKNSHT